MFRSLLHPENIIVDPDNVDLALEELRGLLLSQKELVPSLAQNCPFLRPWNKLLLQTHLAETLPHAPVARSFLGNSAKGLYLASFTSNLSAMISLFRLLHTNEHSEPWWHHSMLELEITMARRLGLKERLWPHSGSFAILRKSVFGSWFPVSLSAKCEDQSHLKSPFGSSSCSEQKSEATKL